MAGDRWRFTFHQKLVAFFSVVLVIATLLVGVIGFLIAKSALDHRGEQILKNSVEQAIMMIELQYSYAKSGIISVEQAQENIKVALVGSKKPDGTRYRTNMIDIGENGYFVIYDSDGNEVMHPTLEGQNVWDVTDPYNDNVYLVQEQIKLAKAGGGFLSYHWQLPDSQRIEEKLAYGKYYKEWDWVVVATAYTKDFNSEANQILISMFLLIFFLGIIIVYMFSIYINTVTGPISRVIEGMEEVKLGEYQTISTKSTNEEVLSLLVGFNQMVAHLKNTQKDLEGKNAQIGYLAYNDEMTGLPNFHGMRKYLDTLLMTGCSQGTLLLIHVSGLNVINAMKGYEVGNQVLKDIGDYLFSHKGDCYPARTSSNEFALWEQEETHVERYMNDLKQLATLQGYGQIVAFQLAITQYPVDGLDFDSLYEKATLVMKLIKDSGKPIARYYEESMKQEVEQDLSMAYALRKALDHGEIIAYYQKKVDYKSGRVCGVEALARWNSPELGIVSPSSFIPAIHHQNMTNEFTKYMIHRILRDYSLLEAKYGEGISLAINITPSSFLDGYFYETVKEAIDQYAIPPKRLILEVTEDVFISDIEDIVQITNRLHDLGVRIAIDDFGTGYSSLNFLTRINFDEMKIDKSFIDRITSDPKVFELMIIFCNIASVYGYDIVAEGVESEVQLDQIRKTPLRIVQGYLYSRPEPL